VFEEWERGRCVVGSACIRATGTSPPHRAPTKPPRQPTANESRGKTAPQMSSRQIEREIDYTAGAEKGGGEVWLPRAAETANRPAASPAGSGRAAAPCRAAGAA